MEYDIGEQLQEIKKEHRRRSTIKISVGAMCCLVVFCVGHSLMLPAISMTKDQTLDCQYEVHLHNDNCFDDEGQVICGYADYIVHTHDAAYCYDSAGNLICPLKEVKIHEHDASCYEEQPVLICGETENNGHAHETSCYTRMQGDLTCENTDSDHVHADECYAWTEELTCGKTEGEGAHQHDESCYGPQTVLTCEEQEVNLHTHSEECYQDILDGEGNVVGQELICGMLQVEEHQHDASCLTAAESAEISVAANGLLYSARISGSYEGIRYTLTPAAGGGYRLILSADTSTAIPSGLFTDETISGYIDQISSVEIGAGITEIGTGAFANLSVLRTVSFDEGSVLTAIGSGAFAGCANLTSVNLEVCTNLLTIEGGDTVDTGAFSGAGLTGITIPGSVTAIGDFAFSNCTSLTDVNFAENSNMVNMGAYVFARCTALESVNIENLKSESLTFGTKDTVTIGETTIANGNGLFYGCTSLQSLTLPNMSGSIAYLCKDCSSLNSLNMSACTKLVCDDTSGNESFRKIIDGCRSLKTLDLSGVTGMTVFYQGIVGGDGDNMVTSGVKTVILPSSVTEVDSYALGYSDVEQLLFTRDENGSSKLKSVGRTDDGHALAATQSLKEVELSFDPAAKQAELYLQSYAFTNCSALKRLTISSPSGLSVFGTPSFLYGCGKLQELVWDVKSVSTTLTWWGGVDGNTSKNIHFAIGENVEVLPGYLLSSLQGNIIEYSFAPGYSFYVDGYYDWSTSPATYCDTFGAPFTEAGCYYADASGNLYRLKDSTAELVYANRSGSGVLNVPGTITAKICTASGMAAEDSTFTVTGVCTDAFAGTAYSSITFEKPENIAKLETGAFAGAYSLEKVNEETTEQEIRALFVNSTFGQDLFVGTKIESLPFERTTAEVVYPGSDNKIIAGNVQINAASDSKLTELKALNHLATGETASITVGVSNDESGHKVRLYLKVSDPDSFKLPEFLSGAKIQSSSVNGVYYCDVPLPESGTNQYTLGIKCNELVAPNKKAYVWLLEADSADVLASIGDTVIEPGETYPADGATIATASSKYIELTWDVLAKDFSVIKAANEDITPTLKKTAGAENASTVVGLSFLVSNSTASRETIDGNSYDSYGADFVESVYFEDVLTIPEGLQWKDGLLNGAYFTHTINADKSGGSITATMGGEDYVLCTLNLASGSLEDLNCAVTDGNLAIRWETANRDRTTEISAAVTTLTYGPEVIEVSGPVSETTEYSVINTVTATPQYIWSGTSAQKNAAATSILTADPSPLAASIEWVRKPTNMGAKAVYELTLDHVADANAAADVDIYTDLGIYQYLAAGEIEKMLLGSEYDGDYLTITINDAVLLPVPDEQTVTAVDGTTTAQTTVRSAATDPVYNDLAKNYDYTAATLTMAKSGECISLTIAKTGGETTTQLVSAGDLQAALDYIGYVRSIHGACTLHWHFPKGTVQAADTHKEYELRATVKNTFQILTEDHNISIVADVSDESHNYPVSGKLYTSAEDYGEKRNAIQTGTVYSLYDLSMDKIAEVDGVQQDTSALAALMEERLQGDGSFIIDYSLDIRHYGTGVYGLLPVVDRMTGVQALLAEVEDNVDAQWITDDIPIYTADGKQYYVLNADGEADGTATYKGVWLENGYADTVTVTKTESGLDTLIKWYYIDDAGSGYTLVPSYRAICSLTYAGHVAAGLYHFVYNEAWLNDVPTRRLHDNIGAEGASIAFKKHIVTKVGDTPAGDELWMDPTTPYTIAGEGAEVTYRLDFKNAGSQDISLTGADFYDILPAVAVDAETGEPVFSWSDANVKVSYSIVGEGVTVSDSTASGYNIIRSGEGSENYQIRWNDDFSIHYPADVSGEVYVYITLTFPKGEEWTQYVAAKGNVMLYNSLYVRGVASQVFHTLPNPGEAMLRKGVYETGYYVLDNTGYTWQYFRGSDRSHYVKTAADSETVKNTVTYFVTLYNSSETANLYLSPIYDLQPEGFQFYGMVTTPDSTDPTVGYSGSVGLWNQWSGRQADSVGLTAWSYAPLAKPANAKLLTWNGGTDNTVKVRAPYNTRMLTFDVTLDAEHKDELGYYLKPGEGIQFGYMCFTGDVDADSADNRCAMEYPDYSWSGVTLTPEEKQTVTVDNSVFTAPANTGSARVITNERAAELGFTQTNPDNPVKNPQWLISRVSLTEGDIIPGITTRVASYNIEQGRLIPWTVTTTNSGNNAMQDYTISDTMQNPFCFTGKVGYTVLSRNANADSVESSERSRKEVVIAGNGAEDYLFEITSVSDNGVVLMSNKGGAPVTVSYGQEQELTVSARFLQSVSAGGSYEDAKITVSFTKAEKGDVTMSIRFADPVWGIPADGESMLTVNTGTPAGTVSTNGVYVNNATITPTQSFDSNSVNQGTVSEDQRYASSAATVNVYTGILTTAYKEVTAGDATGISANYGDADSHDTILLTNKSADITYTLNVVGANDGNMQKLVVIDTLPQTGDTNPINDSLQRGSQFKVNFAASPNVTVKVVNTDGTITPLTEGADDDYTVWYSTKTSGLGKNTDYASDGINTPNGWHADLQADDRSVRIVINRTITENETVKISFHAVIDQSATGDDIALPGEVAWNNFGYSFLTNASMWLYAAPQKVGVTLKSAPTVEKALINSSGDAVAAAAETAFHFVIYRDDITISDCTADSVSAALAGRDFLYVTATVPAGESLSGRTLLNPAELVTYTYENGKLKPTGTAWSWEVGTHYNVVEIDETGDAAGEYAYGYVNAVKNTNRTYTFTYDQTKNQAITVYNTRHDWSISLTKTNDKEQANRLPDAVFGLYSVNENADIVERFADFGLPESTATTYTAPGGTVWHLAQIAVTDKNGVLTWEGLREDKYLVLELRAPNGYILNTQPLELTYAEAHDQNYTVSRTVVNTIAYELPENGGPGTVLFTIAGLVMVAGAGVLFTVRRRCGGGCSKVQ